MSKCNAPNSGEQHAAIDEFLRRTDWAAECSRATVAGRAAILHPFDLILAADHRNGDWLDAAADARRAAAGQPGVTPGVLIYGSPTRIQVEFLLSVSEEDEEGVSFSFADEDARKFVLEYHWRNTPWIFHCEEFWRFLDEEDTGPDPDGDSAILPVAPARMTGKGIRR